jgi:alkylhydroperoxidase family enzyme
MPLLHEIEWEPPAIEPRRDLGAQLRMLRKLGFVPGAIAYYTSCPWIVRSVLAFDIVRFGLVYVDFDFAETIGLVVSQDNSCRFCYAASRAMLRFIGHSEDRIRRLEQNLVGAELNARERLALDFARRVSRANPIPSRAEQEPLRAAGFASGEIREIAYLAALNVYYNRLSTLPAVPTDAMERMGQSGLMKLARPLIGWYLRTRRHRGRLQPLTEEERSGTCSSAVLALDGLPAAKVLRAVIDDAARSTLLSRRHKALVAAVIARGLGCTESEREAQAALAAQGLDAAAVDQILAHLGSPHLDPTEAAMVRVARESIWYRPAEIQRQARALRERLSEGEFLEFVGVTALANAVCRLHAVVDRKESGGRSQEAGGGPVTGSR